VDGKVTTSVKTFKTTTRQLMELSDRLSFQAVTHIAMEAIGVYWKPVWHIFSDGVFKLTLANAAHVKNLPGRKTDVNDATWLADLHPTDLMAHGLIRASFVPDQPTRHMRDLPRTRKQMGRERSSHVQRIRSRQGPKKAIGAVAASILTAAYHMLKDGTLYEVLGASHFDHSNKGKQALRRVNQLQSLGYAVEITSMAA
jgi:transposase